ncbi:uncharacterized protein LOC114532356 isoform X1 [Dendronephthya gigantea]|uniref:uncharacterized protein LOC114532356 isoform X1 n=1 Tax=Dendronephthya gigantea TaxID=151771 RepID=UPI00106A0EAD|nr:uncharacterized protein LOC114532356 isoform X1 [Dendronephthya gigantea]
MCHFSHESNREDAVCRLTFDNGKTWQDLSNVAGLLGISETTGELYGVSMDRRHRLVNKNGMGRGAWNEMGESEWDKVKDSLHKVVEIPNIPVTGLLETDQRQALLTMTANSGDSFSASSLGVYHRPSSGSWTMIATWLCKEYPDICVSSPCDNSGVCHANSDGSFNCTCPLGFSGDVCDQEIDDCKNDSCLNGGQCIDGFNTFYCVCNSFYTGEKCEKNIDDCALSSCSAGAVCIDGLGNFTCQCPSGFAGEFCQLEIDECASLPCQHDGRCVDEVNSYTCYCRQGYSGINCETVHAAVSGFEVLSTQSVLYESSRYTVVHARLPPGGRSRHQTWCHDYTELCYSLNKTRPTGCGRSSNHITEMHQCQTLYDSVMSHNNTLDCPPNVKVSSLAKMAGYSNASPENSFAFSKCGSSECTDALPTSGCHGALSCISQANSEVYTVCADPDSNFMVKSKGYATNKGVSYLSLYVKPLNTSSRHENWCRDYQRLCESYGKRPTGCGNASTECRDKYFSITPKENELDCENNTKVVARISQTAGMPSNTETLNFHICGENKCKKDFPACWAETCLEFNNYNVLCTEPLTGFSVLEERWTLSDNISFLVIKAKLARDRMSTQENWCQDYSTLCKSYGLRPTGRDVIQDYEYTSCRDKYGSIMTDGVFFGSKPQSKIASIAQQAGFSAANEDNSFGLDKCTLCSSVLTKSKCAGLGCMNPSHHNDVYTVCMKKHASEFDILEREKTVYKNTAYLAVKAKVTGIKKWAENYNKTCSQYGRRNVVCMKNASEVACNKSEVLIIFSKHTSLTNATTSNIYIPGVHTPTSDVAYMLCEGPDSNFDVISTKPVSLGGQEYLIIEARLPSNGVARYENWCEDYKQLCLSYGQRPVCCKTETGISSHTACRDNYDALFPRNSQLICPSNTENATLANRTTYFTFAFCNESTCSKNNAMALDASMKTTNTVYALCLASNTSFAVQSSMNVSYQGSTYKIIKARIPLHQTSKQDTWCHDYQTLCNSYGWRAVVTSKDADGSCQRSYEAITPQRHELSTNEKLEHLVKLAGFENAIVGNIFGFGKSCKNSCFASISDSSQVAEPAINLNSSLMSQKNNVIYAVCVNSDTNFHVLDNRRTNYENRSYLVLKTRIPSHGVSKYKSWCLDYQRLCGEYEMRPVSFLSRESQIGSHDMDTYIPHFISVVVFPKNESLKLITREYISIVANLAGYREASRDNSFAFSEHNPGSCSWRLGSKCASSIDCLNIDARELYTVCTDSNSNFLTEDTRHIKYKGLPYLLVRSRVPEDGVARHQTWCSDYKNLCNSFGMQPVICEKQEGCAEDFDFANSSCQLGNITVLKGLVDEQFVKNSSGFMLKGCDKCEKTLEKTCTDQSICSKDAKTTLVPCTKLRHNFRIFESKQINYENVRLSIVKAKITSNTSFYQDWGYDYKKMCSLLGKRPFSCHELGNVIQYKNRKQYNIFLSELKNCSDMEKLQSLAVQAGFSQAKNILFFESSQTTSNELVSQYISGDLTEPSPTKCCKCPNSSANSTDCCLCKKVDPVFQIHLSKCPHGKTCTSFNASEDIYAVCSDFSPTNFDVEDAREVLYADQQYTVVKAQIPPHGQSRSETWCEDYKMLCQAVGKRPVACGRNFDTLKRSRDCRVHYNAIMMQEMSCPGSDEITAIARHAGFSANVNETLGLWNCETCSKNLGENWNIEASSKNLSEVWNIPFSPEGTNETFYIGNTPFTVYLLCSQSESNFNVLEERKVDHAGSPVSVLMTTIPHHGESLNENWCIDYTQLCQSYGSRPIGCGSSADNIEEHAQCRDGYNALMYSKDNIHCQDELKIHEIAKSAGFTEATKQNSFIFKSCLPQQCTKFLPSAEHPFTKFEANLSDGVFYTLCGSSDSAYEVIATRPITVEKQDYLVIRTRIPVEGLSKHVTWCEDYEKLCEAYGMKPLTCKINSHTQRECIYNFGAISLTNADLACPAKTGVASIAKQVGFDNVTNTNSFAMEGCDRSKSCVNKMPNIKCKDTTHYDVSYETKKTQVRMTRADYILNVSKTILNVALNKTQTIIVPEDMHCFIIPSPPSGQPVYKIDGEKLTDIFKSNTCVWNFDLTKPGVTLSYFNLTVNQTFEHRTPRVETNCWLDSSSSLARMSGEANTVCIRPASDTSFRVKSSRKVSKAGREYLIIQAKVLSPESKSSNWCKEYSKLCKAFQTSPLACPRRFGFHKNYDKCITSYGGIMMSEVNYQCPSNGFVSELARAAGYDDSSLANSFSLVDCDDVKCKKVLPATGCSDAVHCLSQEVLHDHVYTACVVANSDSNFNVIETIEKTLSGYDYTVIRARRPANGAPLFQTWCKDYQRLCESFNLRPVYCNQRTISK